MNVTFDSNNLNTFNGSTGILFQGITGHESMPTKTLSQFALAHANKSVIPYVQYPSRQIRITGQINGSSIADLDSRLDTFKGYFLGTDKNLDIDYAGSTRRFIATVNGLAIDRPGGLLYANFTLDIVCNYPFGQNTSNTTALTASGRTAASYSDNHTFLGTAPFQLPTITITFTVLTGGTSQTLFFGNNGTGQGIFITRTWAATDVVVIDCVNKTVTVNGTAVVFTGAFPEFPPGAQTMSYSDSFTTRTFAITVTYPPMFL